MSDPLGIVALYGGMFDPIHLGHIKIAGQLAKHQAISEVRLLPCGVHADKGAAHAPPQHRYNMLKLVAADSLRVDRRELERRGTSYTLGTVKQIRAELGAQTPLAFILGQDAYATIKNWRQARLLPALTHLIVVARNGSHDQNGTSDWQPGNWQAADNLEALQQRPAGLVFFINNALIDISSSQIRSLIAQNIQPRYLLPGVVWSYIQRNKLYGYQAP